MLSHQTKMASMGEMIGNIAHQWRQPLTAISVAAGGIKLNYELDIADISETMLELDNIIDNTQFLSNTIEDFQSFLKNNKSKGHFTIKDTINRTLSIIKGNLVSSEIILIKDYDQYIQINSVQNDLIQVLLNIINNSVDVLKTIQNQKKLFLSFLLWIMTLSLSLFKIMQVEFLKRSSIIFLILILLPSIKRKGQDLDCI